MKLVCTASVSSCTMSSSNWRSGLRSRRSCGCCMEIVFRHNRDHFLPEHIKVTFILDGLSFDDLFCSTHKLRLTNCFSAKQLLSWFLAVNNSSETRSPNTTSAFWNCMLSPRAEQAGGWAQPLCTARSGHLLVRHRRHLFTQQHVSQVSRGCGFSGRTFQIFE